MAKTKKAAQALADKIRKEIAVTDVVVLFDSRDFLKKKKAKKAPARKKRTASGRSKKS